MSTNPISATIDFEKDGIHHGFLKVPYSSNESAWGSIMIPLTVLKNGEGPSALITGANHGDEYEGPIAIFDFAQSAKLSEIRGRVILIPAMNFPAFQAGNRVSPIDSLNMNRVFPGEPRGTVTQIIANYFSQTLLPMSDWVLDIHSGGKTLEFVPFAACHRLPKKELEIRCEEGMKAFGAPYQLKLLEIDANGMYDTQAESMERVFVTTELGGRGTTTPHTVEIAKRGLKNFLIHANILTGELTPSPTPPVVLDMPDDRSFLFSEHVGILEPFAALGEIVNKGDLLVRIYSMERTGIPPYEYHAPRDGMVISRHAPSVVRMGDCLNVIAEVVES
ncbi:MAG: N-alpha-acetyl diaminobutyric acid deacetylase DoeB [SAR324 cluster bacterium]|nr:N-alpha-acetyl diaminobutyric acid deacetylase DoeB [SAR324 cluster bacterium]